MLDSASMYQRERQALVISLLADYGGQCGLCERPLHAELAQVDHIVPKAAGGSNDRSNLQPTHPSCNLARKTNDFTRSDGSRPFPWVTFTRAASILETTLDAVEGLVERGAIRQLTGVTETESCRWVSIEDVERLQAGTVSVREAAARLKIGRPSVRRLIRQRILTVVNGRIPAEDVQRLLTEGATT